MSIHILGIRHHGPGSARNVRSMIEKIGPDIILVEGPTEGEALLQWIIHNEMKPPVAILAYRPDEPNQASFYPFAEFSPEWQALHYAVYNNIPVKFMDLPLSHSFALEKEEISKEKKEKLTEDEKQIARDPLFFLAQAAGYDDSEIWWEHMFEQRMNDEACFDAVMEAMNALRTTLPSRDSRHEQLREAWMRKVIRAAEKDQYKRIAVICGAWHGPALLDMPKQKEDDELLKKLPKVKVETTWIPWTYNRLTFASGYGAGILSPGWYHHLWDHPADDGTRWMSKIAHLLRAKGMDTSTAHVIEGVRLAEMLATLRERPHAGLHELTEATQSVLCNGEDTQLQLIHRELIVSNRLGQVPREAPKVPLQLDLEKLQKKLRLPALPDPKDYQLDLREANDLARSILLHRLTLLGIQWGETQAVSGKGTFKEHWTLTWQPELTIRVIEMGAWGNTVEEAATKYVINTATEINSLPAIAKLLQNTIPAELPAAAEKIMERIKNLAAVSSDIMQLMEALPSLAYVSRYGNVRKTDLAFLVNIVKGLMTRISIGLPSACQSLDEEAASDMVDHLSKANEGVQLLQDKEMQDAWISAMNKLSSGRNIVAGYAARLLYDQKALSDEEIARRFSVALSTGNEPAHTAAWVEGFLRGSGMILLLDSSLWSLLDNWIGTLSNDTFVQLLPLMRRTFAHFTPAERRKMGEKAKGMTGAAMTVRTSADDSFNHDRAKKALPVISELLGMKN